MWHMRAPITVFAIVLVFSICCLKPICSKKHDYMKILPYWNLSDRLQESKKGVNINNIFYNLRRNNFGQTIHSKYHGQIAGLVGVNAGNNLNRTDSKTTNSHEKTGRSSLSLECPKDWVLFRNKCFTVNESKLQWTDASTMCRNYGGYLASIHSEEENEFLMTNLVSKFTTAMWIGLNCRRLKDVFEWEDQSPVDYTNWAPGEPSGTKHGAEECVQILNVPEWPVGKWNDVWCSVNLPSICQLQAKCVDPRCVDGTCQFDEKSNQFTCQCLEHYYFKDGACAKKCDQETSGCNLDDDCYIDHEGSLHCTCKDETLNLRDGICKIGVWNLFRSLVPRAILSAKSITDRQTEFHKHTKNIFLYISDELIEHCTSKGQTLTLRKKICKILC